MENLKRLGCESDTWNLPRGETGTHPAKTMRVDTEGLKSRFQFSSGRKERTSAQDGGTTNPKLGGEDGPDSKESGAEKRAANPTAERRRRVSHTCRLAESPWSSENTVGTGR